MTATARRSVVKKLLKVVDDPEMSPACVVQAARALIDADRINVDCERRALELEGRLGGGSRTNVVIYLPQTDPVGPRAVIALPEPDGGR
jgi:hypothetical protein